MCFHTQNKIDLISLINTSTILYKINHDGYYLSAPPSITLSPPRQVVRPGDNAFIHCSATGDQPIKIDWHPLNRAMPVSASVNEGYLMFQRIQTSDAGKYRCTAVNSGGEADGVAEVIVQGTVFFNVFKISE